MPQEFHYPTSGALDSTPGGYNSWGPNTGTSNSATRPGGGRAGPMTHDDDASYITTTFNGTINQALNPDWPGPMAQWSGVLTLGFRSRFGGGSPAWNRGVGFVTSGGTAGGTVTSVNNNNFSYVTTGPGDATGSRPGGGAWTYVDFANSTAFQYWCWGISSPSSPGDSGFDTTGLVTSVWGEVSYDPPAGGFAFLLNLVGAAALPFVGRMVDIAQFRSYLSWRRRYHPRHTILTGDEVRRAWDEIKAYRHPVFFLPKVA